MPKRLVEIYNVEHQKFQLSSDSVSKIKLILEVKGKSKLSCELKRHLSPRTVGIIQRSLPLEGNAHFFGNNIVYLETPIDSGIERPRQDFKKGDVAFLPASGSICFFVEDTSPGKTLTPVGKITSNVDLLKDIKSGEIISLYAETG